MSKNVAKLAFWGVRGSTPTSDPSTRRFGGNTPCLALETPDGGRFILDCGTGLRLLGNHWLEEFPRKSLEASILLTHYHWDHIQGIPFFIPLYDPHNHFHFYSFRSSFLGANSLRQALATQMASPYFPVNPGVITAAWESTEIIGGDEWEIGGTRITARWLNHPQGCLGFRFETSAGTIVYATDNEPGVPELDDNLQQLARDADIFINDAQYTPEQLAGDRKGWGHSSWLEGVKVAEQVGARNLVLFHHDPESTDRFVDSLLQEARRRFARVWVAADGMAMTLGNGQVEVCLGDFLVDARGTVGFPATVTGVGEDGRSFQENAPSAELSLRGAQFLLEHPPRLQSEITLAIDRSAAAPRPGARILLRGFVVRRETRPENGRIAVTVIFTEKAESI
jgi:phosphoribosyl 1,2-cyclic phosphodiesterase